jgi:hypothetical protein
VERIQITRKWLDKIGEPACPTDSDNMEDASILILTAQLMAEAGVGGRETTLPLLALAAGTSTGDYRAPLVTRGDF